MSWQNEAFKNFRLYAVTDLRSGAGEELTKIEAACRGGADVIQLRAKALSDAVLLRVGRKIRKIASKFRKLFFVNDRVDLAVLLDSDGVHLGQDDMPVADARALIRRAGSRLRIGCSTHDLRQAMEAERQGVDYIGVGPVFQTPTKPGRAAVGLKLVAQVAKAVKVPWVAIGGIALENVDQVVRAGARRIAVVRAVFDARDPALAAQKLRQRIER